MYMYIHIYIYIYIHICIYVRVTWKDERADAAACHDRDVTVMSIQIKD